jgi:phosphohistidine swiveling domain-containing protein
MITVEYECEDGTPFPVRFRDEPQAAKTWRLDRAHERDPATPLFQAMQDVAVPGGKRVYEETDLVFPPSFLPGPDALGFPYFDTAPLADEDMAKMFSGCAKLLETHGSALGVWRDRCLPATKAAIAEINAAGREVPFATIAELQSYAHHHTMIPAYICGNDLTLLAAALAGVVPESDAALIANELGQGYENETLRADQRLWELAQHARTIAVVRDALHASEETAESMRSLRDRDRGAGVGGFFDALDAYLADYGFRAEGWDIACPTWTEQREGFWAQLRQLASDSAPEPEAAMAKAAARREALIVELESAFTDDAALQRFRRRLARIEPYVAVREERALWQVATTGAVRHAALRRGEALVANGALERPEDVLFLRPDEMEGRVADRRALVDGRGAEHERRCALTPPVQIGGDAPVPMRTAAPDGVLRGVGGSRGVVAGRARVIVDLADADRLEPGDVLVCVMTSPPWTPLFGLAAAVVVETGDMGSHPAIAAREYGIPCVVGCEAATRSIADGELITVDGVEGTVRRGS